MSMDTLALGLSPEPNLISHKMTPKPDHFKTASQEHNQLVCTQLTWACSHTLHCSIHLFGSSIGLNCPRWVFPEWGRPCYSVRPGFFGRPWCWQGFLPHGEGSQANTQNPNAQHGGDGPLSDSRHVPEEFPLPVSLLNPHVVSTKKNSEWENLETHRER